LGLHADRKSFCNAYTNCIHTEGNKMLEFLAGLDKATLTIVLFFPVLISLFVYLAPAFVAFYREHERKAGILTLNIFVGWTIIGWIYCLIWARRDD
jgi:hypothetical protein